MQLISVCVCACVCARIVNICVCLCMCVCNCYLASESREGIEYQVTLWIAAEKPSSNNVLLQYTYLY